jgi:hypothetical protein
MGRAVPKEFRDPLLSFMDGERLRLCMYASASEMEDLMAGTSMELRAWPSVGMASVAPWLPTAMLLFLPGASSKPPVVLGLIGGDLTPKSESSKVGMVIERL